MGTSFHVYPAVTRLPTFGEVIGRATAELHRFLESVGVDARPTLAAHLRRGPVISEPLAPDLPARWDSDVDAWFTVDHVPGGTDADYSEDAAAIRRYWDTELAPDPTPNCRRLESLIRNRVATGRCWTFNRWGGAAPTTNLTYGLIAGSVAALTEGFVYSADGAWDFERFPATGVEFLSWYFRPQHALSDETRNWSRRCIDALAGDLAGESDNRV